MNAWRARGPLIALITALAVGAVVRLVALGSFPLFVDEATYLGWADQFAAGGPAWASLDAGKQPLPIWIAALFVHVGADPLMAVRVMAAIFGIIAMVLFALLARRFVGGWALALVVWVYALAPYAVLHQRMFLYEVFLEVFFLVALLFAFRYWTSHRIAGLAVVAVALSAGMWTKTTTVAVICGLLVATAYSFGGRFLQRRAFWIAVAAIAVVPILSTLLLYLGPSSPGSVQGVNGSFQTPYISVLTEPLARPMQVLTALVDYWWKLVGPVASLMVLLALALGGWRRRQLVERQILLVLVVAFLLASSLVDVYAPRYYLFTLAPGLLIGIAWAARVFDEPRGWLQRISAGWRRAGAWVLGLLMIVFPAVQTGVLLADYPRAWLPDQVRDSYITGWSASPDFDVLRDAIRQNTRGKDEITLWTDGTPGWDAAFLPWFRSGSPTARWVAPVASEANKADVLVMQGTLPHWNAQSGGVVDESAYKLVAQVRRQGKDVRCTIESCGPELSIPTSVYVRTTPATP